MIVAGIRESARRFGWPKAAAQTAHKVLARLARVRCLHVLWLGSREAAGAGSGPAAGLEVRPLSAEELLRAAADPELDLEPDFAIRALDGGSVCLGAFVQGALAGYAWFGRSGLELYAGLTVSVGGREAYAYKVFTRPRYRKRRCQAAIMDRALAMPVLPGAERLVCLVEAANLVSLAAFARMGFARDGRLVLLGRGARRRWVRLGGGRHVEPPHVTAVAAARG